MLARRARMRAHDELARPFRLSSPVKRVRLGRRSGLLVSFLTARRSTVETARSGFQHNQQPRF